MATTQPIPWKKGDLILGQYEVLSLLGQGGMGMVYRLHHRSWNVDLAAKAPRPEIFTRERGKEHFIQEAETWVKLHLHPHIVSCYYIRIIDAIPCLFTEYVDGGDLAIWMRRGRLYEEGVQRALERILDVAIQFAWGLDAAHNQGLVHQDVKPANVLVTDDGMVKVTDFGLARAREIAGEAGRTLDGNLQGSQQSILVTSHGLTPAYCSPEQAAHQRLSRKTDIWSWAVSVLEMFLGQVTWGSGVMAGEALTDYLSNGQPEPSLPAMPAGVASLLQRCFQVQPDQRPATMAEVAETLRTLYQDIMGEPYPRQIPQMIDELADSFNNRALSLLDLGKVEEAQTAWQQAIHANPYHLEALYNAGIYAWQRGELPDDELVKTIVNAWATQHEKQEAPYLLAQVHLARGAIQEALPLLEQSAQEMPGNPELAALLAQARGGTLPTTGPVRLLSQNQYFSGRLNGLSADGKRALVVSPSAPLLVVDVESGETLYELNRYPYYVVTGGISANGGIAAGISYSYDSDNRANDRYKDRTVSIYNLENGQCLHRIREHSATVENLSVSANGRFMITGDLDGTARIWEVATGRCLYTFPGPGKTVCLCAISGDGLRFVTCHDQFVSFNAAGPSDTGSKVTALSLSADGQIALTGGADGRLLVWDVTKGRLLRELRGHRDEISSLSLSADGKLALSGSYDKTMRLWQVATGMGFYTHLPSDFQASRGLVTVALSADGHRALASIAYLHALSRQKIWVWQIATRRPTPLYSLSQYRSSSESVEIRRQAIRWLHEAEEALSQQQIARSLALLTQVRQLPHHEHWTESIHLFDKLKPYCTPTTLRYGVFSGQGENPSAGQREEATPARQVIQDPSRNLAVSGNAQVIVTGGGDELVCLWDRQGKLLAPSLPGPAPVMDIALSADGKKLLAGYRDGTLRFWDLETQRCLQVLEGHQERIQAIALSADGKLAFSSGVDNYLHFWDVSAGRSLWIQEGHIRVVAGHAPNAIVGLSADGRLACSAGQDGKLCVWDGTTGYCLHMIWIKQQQYQSHDEAMTALTMSADGKTILTGDAHGRLSLWDATTGQLMQTHTEAGCGHISSVCLSMDQRLALAAYTEGIRVWEIATGRCLVLLQAQNQARQALALSTDQRTIISSGSSHEFFRWTLEWDYEAHVATEHTWDEGVLPYLEAFLYQHIPTLNEHLAVQQETAAQVVREQLMHIKPPVWTEQDSEQLFYLLADAGYGWVPRNEIKRKLEELAGSWREADRRNRWNNLFRGRLASVLVPTAPESSHVYKVAWVIDDQSFPPAVYPKIREFLSQFSGTREECQRIAHYLYNGTVLVPSGERGRDCLHHDGKVRSMALASKVVSNAICTDGVWIWSRGLAYYAEVYQAIPGPEAFYRHIVAHDYVCPAVSEEAAKKLLDWWLKRS